MRDWIFRCKTCNAMLDELAVKSTNGLVQCPYCFNIWTIPKKETSPAALQFLRMGEHDLDTCKFDDAFTAYKKAAELDEKEPEAYFGMALAEFKVQYLKDHVNNRLQPICHETTEKKFTDSASFLKALRFATNEQRAEYEKKGAEIDYILGEFYRLKESKLDYDCFICVKVTDDSTKQPTEDSKDADYIYRLLQDKGYKPFYSERELRNVTGADYEARILYALYMSECMLVVCRKEEYLQTPWVKNEYTRFLKLVNDEEKESDSVTIVFNGTPIERLPGRNGKLQGINFALRESDGKILDFVEKHTPEAKAKREAELRRKAEEEERKKTEEEARRIAFEKQQKDFEARQNRILEEQKKELERIREQSQVRTDNHSAAPSEAATAGTHSLLRRMYLFLEDKDWENARVYAERVLDIDPQTAEAYLGELLAELQITKFENLPKHTEPIKTLPLFKKAYRFADKEFKAKLDAAIANNVEVLENKRIGDVYNKASRRERNASREFDFLEAAKLFESISAFKDSAERAKQCHEKAECAREEARKKAEKAELQRKEQVYQDGCAKLGSGDLESVMLAKEAFASIRGFKDADVKITECDREIVRLRLAKKDAIYTEACKALSVGDVETASKARKDFVLLGDYKDSKEKVAECDAKLAEFIEIKEENARRAAVAAAKQKKKNIIIAIVSVSIAVAIIIAIIVAVVVTNHNEKVASAGLKYTLSEDGSYYIVSGVEDRTLDEYAIPETYHGLPVKEIGEYALDLLGMTSVVIPDSITTIREHAFWSCKNLTSITIGSRVVTIEENAFLECSKLAKVNITDLTAWCKIDFQGTYDSSANPLNYAKHLYLDDVEIKELTFPQGLNEIKPYAFYSCEGIQKVTIPSGMISIGQHAFDGCSNLTSISLPNSITKIDDEVFYASGLTSITIPDSVTTIGSFAFGSCTGLTEITIPKNVAMIDQNAFAWCHHLQMVHWNAKICAIEGGYAIDSPFSECNSLTTVIIGNEVERLPDYFLSYCRNVTGISIPDNVTSIGEKAFSNCDELVNVTIGKGVTTIGYEAFYNSDALTLITIPDNVTTIQDRAFYGCDSLASVTIGRGLTLIGEKAFSLCSKLTNAYFKDPVGWQTTYQMFTSEELSNPATAATYLTDKYDYEEWRKG